MIPGVVILHVGIRVRGFLLVFETIDFRYFTQACLSLNHFCIYIYIYLWIWFIYIYIYIYIFTYIYIFMFNVKSVCIYIYTYNTSKHASVSHCSRFFQVWLSPRKVAMVQNVPKREFQNGSQIRVPPVPRGGAPPCNIRAFGPKLQDLGTNIQITSYASYNICNAIILQHEIWCYHLFFHLKEPRTGVCKAKKQDITIVVSESVKLTNLTQLAHS